MDKINLTKRGKNLEKANDEFYKILKKLEHIEQKEFLLLITKYYLVGLLEKEQKLIIKKNEK